MNFKKKDMMHNFTESMTKMRGLVNFLENKN